MCIFTGVTENNRIPKENGIVTPPPASSGKYYVPLKLYINLYTLSKIEWSA